MISRQEKIKAIIDSMACWEERELLKWAQMVRQEQLEKAGDKEVDDTYRGEVDEDF